MPRQIVQLRVADPGSDWRGDPADDPCDKILERMFGSGKMPRVWVVRASVGFWQSFSHLDKEFLIGPIGDTAIELTNFSSFHQHSDALVLDAGLHQGTLGEGSNAGTGHQLPV